MKFLITGGGTGGHIYPALAIAYKVKEKYENADILYVGTKNGMESELVPKEGFEFRTIRVRGFSRNFSIETLKSMKELLLGLNDARKIINSFKPDIVIGTGGYVCGPVVLIAALKKIPTIIHEQNALPGITNKILSRFVDKVAASFEVSKKYFKYPEKITITGNPIRNDILTIDKNLAYIELKIDKNKKFILSFGGSGGQKSLNDAMMDVIINNLYNNNIQIIHVTGKRFFDSFIHQLKDKGISLNMNKNIRVVPYLFDMPKYLNIADLVITSAGAITIAEITALGKPSILIPKAYTAENHQEYNARALENKGASIVITEKELEGEKLNKMIIDLLNDESKLFKMSKQSKKLGITNSSDRILKLIEDYIN